MKRPNRKHILKRLSTRDTIESRSKDVTENLASPLYSEPYHLSQQKPTISDLYGLFCHPVNSMHARLHLKWSLISLRKKQVLSPAMGPAECFGLSKTEFVHTSIHHRLNQIEHSITTSSTSNSPPKHPTNTVGDFISLSRFNNKSYKQAPN